MEESWPQSPFVIEPKASDRHAMGSHWQPFYDDPAEIISNLPEIVGKARLPVGFGDRIECPEAPSHWVRGVHLSWPNGNQGLMLTLTIHTERNQLISLYPFYRGGTQIRATLDQVLVWESGVEAQVTVLIGDTPLTFFDTLFLNNRHLYKSGSSLAFILTGIAYAAEPAQQSEVPLPEDSELNQWIQISSDEHGNAAKETVSTLSLEGAAILIPIKEWDADDYQFRGPVKEVGPVDEILGQSGWLVVVTVLRGVEEDAEDFDLKVLITERAWSGQTPPKVGQDISGTLWLQGFLWSNYSAY